VGASITIRRRIQWMDTDAAGIWHHSTAIRLIEEAEAELHRSLGIVDETFGATPRVRIALDFHEAVAFDDEVSVTLDVSSMGTASMTYAATLATVENAPVATGEVVVVLIDRHTGQARPWPDDLRAVLHPG
jgi:YbgC/YbaW family acyl-CoA thioester hydrolase